jgi:hypothetical protein
MSEEDAMSIKPSLLKLLVLAIVVAACGAPAAKPDAMMEKGTPTAEVMMAQATPTTGAMMMHETPTADAMMAQATATPEAMMAHEMPTADAMMAHETPTANAMMSPATPAPDAMMTKSTPTAEAMVDKNTMAALAWFSAKLTDVSMGESFQVTDFQDKVILVETMAVWCTTCLQQQQQIQALHSLLGKRDDLVSLSLDIDPNENDGILKAAVNSRGFDWMFAVAPANVAREIGQLYGDQFLNPPSAPMFIIDRQGKVHPLQFGVKSAQDLKVAVEPYLKQGA